MKTVSKIRNNSFFAASFLLFAAAEVYTQVAPVVPVQPAAPEPAEDFTWWYVLLFMLFAGLAAAVFWWKNSRKADQQTSAAKAVQAKKAERLRESESLDFDKEIEWLRQNQKLVDKNHKPKSRKTKKTGSAVQTSKVKNVSSEEEKQPEEVSAVSLPVFSIKRLEYARPFNALPISNDESLLNAIEQVYEELEEDEEIRELAVKILAMFKTRNSVEALSQVALYDISSNLRSKAVGVLAEFDHESVFEAILLACADPTREVRAAAARGLFRLSFDRADAWTRIGESKDEYKMRQSARAAIEGDLVTRSFDRLVHKDKRYAYETITLVALLLKSGETEIIFDTLENHSDLNVRKAILHVIKVVKEPNVLERLCELSENSDIPEELKQEIDEAIKELDLVEV